jgi:hypothetical protein
MEDKKLKGDLGEEFVNNLAYKTFLKFWCYPNPKDEEGDKKEICDLLICFKDVLIIFSVKNWEFKGNYDKYHRKTIKKAVRQIYGAERKLFNIHRKIFIKHPDKEKEEFQSNNYKKIHRCIINLGEGVEFSTSGEFTKKGKFIHIFNKDFEVLMQELDTIPDLITYLEARENLLIGGEKVHILGSEKDLLAPFLKNARSFPPEFHKECDTLFLDVDGAWDEYDKDEKIGLKRMENKISYFIDEFVKDNLTKPNTKDIAEEWMSLTRLERRMLTKMFFDLVSNSYKKKENSLLFNRRYVPHNDTGFLFIYYSPNTKEKFIDPLMELATLGTALYRNYKESKILVIATTTAKLADFKIGCYKVKQLEKEHEEKILNQVRSLGWFKNLKIGRYDEKEYPDE